MRGHPQAGDTTGESPEDSFRGAKSEPEIHTRVAVVPASGDAGRPRPGAGVEALPATDPRSSDAGTGWDPWEVWLREIERPRRLRGLRNSRKR